MMRNRSFAKIGRYILIVWLVPVFYLPGANQVLELIEPGSEWYWYDILYSFYYRTLFFLILALLVLVNKIDWRGMFGRVNKADLVSAMKLTGFVFVFSVAAAYALFYPLSYYNAEFVKDWYINLPPVIYSKSGQFPLLPNFMSFLSLVVLAPIVEEFAFRGLLMPRWREKWGRKKAILFSSVLFGIIHPDPIGATAFGIAMCVVYLKTGTLWVPMICHALNNCAVWVIQAGYTLFYGSGFIYTLKNFRDEWFVGLICGLIAIVWGSVYVKKTKRLGVWPLPGA